MSENTLQVSDEIIFHTEGLDATILVDGEEYVTLGRDDLGAIAEWLAVAWENVAGESYEHQEYDKTAWPQVKAGEWVIPKAYVNDEGMVGNARDAIEKRAAAMPGLDMLEDFANIASRIPREVRVERDCE